MREIDEMTEAETAWVLLEQIENTKNMLLQKYHYEFMSLEKRKESLQMKKDNLPF
jgi:hypothetical protein